LLRPIVEQLIHCPRSVIILDDIHHVDAAIIDSLKTAFDPQADLRCHTGPFANHAVSTQDAIFIATSDLEESQSRLLPDLSKSDAIKLIKQLANERWASGDKGGSKQLQLAVSLQLASVIPFLRLTDLDLIGIILQSFKGIETTIRTQLARHAKSLPHYVEWVGTLRLERNLPQNLLALLQRDIVDYGARAIGNYIDNNVYSALHDLVLRLLNSKQSNMRKPSGWMGVMSRDTLLLLDDIEVSLVPQAPSAGGTAPAALSGALGGGNVQGALLVMSLSSDKLQPRSGATGSNDDGDEDHVEERDNDTHDSTAASTSRPPTASTAPPKRASRTAAHTTDL